MNLLVIETATDACSCALSADTKLHVAHEVAPRRHAEIVLDMIAALLAETGLAAHDLDAIGFGRGPGSFTGVRIAASVAQGLAFGAGVPVVGVSTLRVLAQGARRQRGVARILAAFDARMDEVYFGAYEAGDDGLVHPACDEYVGPPERAPVPGGADWLGAGEGWHAYGERLGARFGSALAGADPERLPHARDLVDLAAAEVAAGRTVAAEHAIPVYLRNRVATPRR